MQSRFEVVRLGKLNEGDIDFQKYAIDFRMSRFLGRKGFYPLTRTVLKEPKTSDLA